jgi:large subunit ribosomal protein L30
MAKTFRLKLVRGLARTTQSQKDAVRCLGLAKINQEVVVKDSPAMRGNIYKVNHLLDVKLEK